MKYIVAFDIENETVYYTDDFCSTCFLATKNINDATILKEEGIGNGVIYNIKKIDNVETRVIGDKHYSNQSISNYRVLPVEVEIRIVEE